LRSKKLSKLIRILEFLLLKIHLKDMVEENNSLKLLKTDSFRYLLMKFQMMSLKKSYIKEAK